MLYIKEITISTQSNQRTKRTPLRWWVIRLCVTFVTTSFQMQIQEFVLTVLHLKEFRLYPSVAELEWDWNCFVFAHNASYNETMPSFWINDILTTTNEKVLIFFEELWTGFFFISIAFLCYQIYE